MKEYVWILEMTFSTDLFFINLWNVCVQYIGSLKGRYNIGCFDEYAYFLWINIYITKPTCESLSSMHSLSHVKKKTFVIVTETEIYVQDNCYHYQLNFVLVFG